MRPHEMEKRFFTIFILLFLSLALFLDYSWGADKQPVLLGKSADGQRRIPDQPIRITSAQLEVDNKSGVILFKGNVVAKQGEMTIYADASQVFYEKKEEGNEVREIVATGNVRIQEGNRLATAQKAVFINEEQKIILTGQPKVWQGKDMVSGEKITILLEEDKSYVEGGPERRVEVILYPKGESTAEKGKP